MHSEGGAALKGRVIFSALKASCEKKKHRCEIETNRSGLNWEQDVERAENNLSQPANPAALEVWEGVNKTTVGDQCENSVITDRLARQPQMEEV